MELVIVDLAPFLADPSSAEALREADKAADALKRFSCLAVRDPRANEQENSAFLDLLEDYFSQPTETKLLDVRREFSYQVGATPELTEAPKCGRDEPCLQFVAGLDDKDKPLDFHGADPKWRFFWRIGPRPAATRFQELNAAQVVPRDFPQWPQVMDQWGGKLLSAVDVLSQMVAVGLGLPQDTFSSRTANGPHLLAPTASDLVKFGAEDTVLAGFHYDLNFLTIHGKSRYPGLHIWERSGRKLLARIPDGCLLVQAGKQMEWLTGGVITAGYHEVVVRHETLEAKQRQAAKGRPLWRISSTLFQHIASDQLLGPLPPFKTKEAEAKYPYMLTGDHVKMELGLINLSGEE